MSHSANCDIYIRSGPKERRHDVLLVPKNRRHVRLVPKDRRHDVRLVPKDRRHDVRLIPNDHRHGIQVLRDNCGNEVFRNDHFIQMRCDESMSRATCVNCGTCMFHDNHNSQVIYNDGDQMVTDEGNQPANTDGDQMVTDEGNQPANTDGDQMVTDDGNQMLRPNCNVEALFNQGISMLRTKAYQVRDLLFSKPVNQSQSH